MVLGWFSKGKVNTEKGKGGDSQGGDNYRAEEIVRLAPNLVEGLRWFDKLTINHYQ